jgi:hypothetical protein
MQQDQKMLVQLLLVAQFPLVQFPLVAEEQEEQVVVTVVVVQVEMVQVEVLEGPDYHQLVVILATIPFLSKEVGKYLVTSKLRIPAHFCWGFSRLFVANLH